MRKVTWDARKQVCLKQKFLTKIQIHLENNFLIRVIKRMEENILKRWIDLWHKCCSGFTNAYLSSSFVCQAYLNKVLFLFYFIFKFYIIVFVLLNIFLKRKRIVSLRASTRIIKYAEGEIRKITFPKIFLDITPNSWLAVVLRAYCRWYDSLQRKPERHHQRIPRPNQWI